MKIAIITPGFSASEQDWCIPALLDFVRCLATRDEVHVFPLRYPSPPREYRVFDACVHAIGGGQGRKMARLSILARGRRAVVAEHRRAPFQVLHALWAEESDWLAVRVGRRLGVPVVVTLMGGELTALPDIGYGAQLSWFGRHTVASALRAAAWSTAGSHQLLVRARRLVPECDPSRLSVLPLGIDPVLFAPTGRALPASDTPAVLHVGSLTPVKNQRMLLQAFRTVADARADVELRIVGDGPLRGELESFAWQLDLEGRVTFYGERPHDELPAWYRGATLCALSSRHEGQSLVALEAAACGRAIVGPEVGLLTELAPVCRTVPVGDEHALATALLELLKDDKLRRSMGHEGRQLVEERYTVEHSVAAFQTIYATLASRPARLAVH